RRYMMTLGLLFTVIPQHHPPLQGSVLRNRLQRGDQPTCKFAALSGIFPYADIILLVCEDARKMYHKRQVGIWSPSFVPHYQSAMDLLIRFMLQLTPFANMRAVDDHARILAQLIAYWKWDIDAYRTYLNPNIRADNAYIVLCALVFLIMAEWMHLHYSGLTSEELKERIYAIGRRTFAILAVIPRLGVIIIRIVEIVVIADSPALACGLIVASMFPALIFPLILSGSQQLQVWIAN
ncbi:hypothetical protein EDD15DRAFT_2318860, partial [Pisolithus albus]